MSVGKTQPRQSKQQLTFGRQTEECLGRLSTRSFGQVIKHSLCYARVGHGVIFIQAGCKHMVPLKLPQSCRAVVVFTMRHLLPGSAPALFKACHEARKE